MSTTRFSLFLLIFLPFLTRAQDSSSVVIPGKGSMGLGMNVSGVLSNIGLSSERDEFGNNLIFARFYSKDQTAWRASVGFSGGQFQTLQTDSLGGALRQFDSSYAKVNAHLSVGIEQHVKTKGRLDPYFGGDLSLGILGNTRIKTSTSLQDTSGTSSIQIDEKYRGGLQFGLRGVAGFNYFIADNIALGAEYTLGYAFSTQGGDFDIITTTTPITGNPTIRRETGSQVFRSNQVVMSSNIGIRFAYFFSRPKNE